MAYKYNVFNVIISFLWEVPTYQRFIGLTIKAGPQTSLLCTVHEALNSDARERLKMSHLQKMQRVTLDHKQHTQHCCSTQLQKMQNMSTAAQNIKFLIVLLPDCHYSQKQCSEAIPKTHPTHVFNIDTNHVILLLHQGRSKLIIHFHK